MDNYAIYINHVLPQTSLDDWTGKIIFANNRAAISSLSLDAYASNQDIQDKNNALLFFSLVKIPDILSLSLLSALHIFDCCICLHYVPYWCNSFLVLRDFLFRYMIPCRESTLRFLLVCRCHGVFDYIGKIVISFV